ncbi:MAG: SRPBCC family protein [Flavobacteriales bacterium]
MKILKKILIGLGALFLIYLMLCAFGPSSLDVVRSTMMKGSQSAVFEEIGDFHKVNAWSPWYQRDTAMKHTITGEAYVVGHKMEWDSETQGSGIQTITEAVAPSMLRTELAFKGWSDVSHAQFDLEQIGDSVKVSWSMENGEVPFMFRGMMLLMNGKKMISDDYDLGLANLKKIVEAKPQTAPFEVEKVQIAELHYVGKRFQIPLSGITEQLYSQTYEELFKHIGGPEKAVGPIFSLTHQFDDANQTIDMEIAVPVAADVKAMPGGTEGTIPAGNALKHVYMGAYDQMMGDWEKMMKAASKYEQRYAVYEVYVNDPSQVKSPNELITHLFVPVK